MKRVDALEVLKQYWGHTAFRSLQAQIIESVLDGHDTLALLPTGGGKSICFQVPALILDGLCLVVTPLIALMKDQVEQLTRRGIAATALHSGLSAREIDHLLEECTKGSYRFLYVSPERLGTTVFLARLDRLGLKLLAIDEAHCIAQWGHDFRPEYLKIIQLREKLPGVPLVALTATATPEVVDQIRERLGMTKGNLFQAGFGRPNLTYSVDYTEDQTGRLLKWTQNLIGSGIVYADTRKKTERWAEVMRKSGVSADYYHAGLAAEDRQSKQDAWIQGKIKVMACTSAFGMGIDKPDVRLVVHMSPPDCLEAYFQEAGRAGRDGQASKCILIYHSSDRKLAEKRLGLSFPPRATIYDIYHKLGIWQNIAIGDGKGMSRPFVLLDFCREHHLQPPVVHHSLNILHRAGYLLVDDSLLVPSRLRFTCPARELDEFRATNPVLGRMVEQLLRSYTGIMDEYAAIDEVAIGRKLGMATDELRAGLEELKRKKIAQYIPRSDQPLLVWLRDRVPESHLHLPPENYSRLKERKHAQLQSMLSYAEQSDVCRATLLLDYFGEQESPPCGQCDVCIQYHHERPDPALFASIRQQINQTCQGAPTTLKKLVEGIKPGHPAQIRYCIRYLADEGLLRIDEQENVYLTL
jgi:ATP-dependent DNA helicase RecQ